MIHYVTWSLCILLLIDKWADVPIPDLYGRICSYLAAQNGHLEALQLLLDYARAWDVRDSPVLDALQSLFWQEIVVLRHI